MPRSDAVAEADAATDGDTDADNDADNDTEYILQHSLVRYEAIRNNNFVSAHE